ncbi:MAG: hypothetical protein RLQ12_03590 [Cyclobacteriaceae bacterium]
MRYLVLTIFFLSITLACDSDQSEATGEGESVPGSAIITPVDGMKDLSNAQIVVGGTLVEEGQSFNGLKHGSWVSFDENGLITGIITYHKGVKQGASIEIDNQGYITTYSNFANNQLSGSYKVYNRRRLIEERTYVKGKLEGLLRKFYQDGTQMEESNYQNGVLNGIAKWYDTEGNLSIAYEYENGKLVNQEAEVE